MKTYDALYQVLDNGPMMTQLIVDGTYPDPEAFTVVVDKIDPDTGKTAMTPVSWMSPELKPECGLLYIKDAVIEDGKTILTPKYGPALRFSSMNTYKGSFTHLTEPKLTIFYNGELISNEGTCTLEKRDQLNLSRPISGISRAWTAPVPADAKNPPLIIWLHGAGEGGTDPYRSPLCNKAINIASDEIQAFFGGAYVLYPECLTMWLDDGSGEYGDTGRSMYTQDLMNAILFFLEEHPEIDRKRIYIGGCSNGGFMTLRMLIDYPGFFAAAYPVCEALYDKTISDENIKELAKTPIWFTHASNDPVVNPLDTAVPTYKRLLAAGAENLHFSYFDKVIDTSGKFFKEDGTPYEYFGHGTWIYAFNNESTFDFDKEPVLLNGKPTSLFEWLAAQSL